MTAVRPRTEMTTCPSKPLPWRLGWLALTLLAAGVLGACGGSDGPPLEPLAAEGREITRNSGCAACHGRNGDGGVGPSWVGRFGTTAELESGEQVLVDADYLTRSIQDPEAEKVAGFTVTMPENNLTVAEVEAVVAYIQALG